MAQGRKRINPDGSFSESFDTNETTQRAATQDTGQTTQRAVTQDTNVTTLRAKTLDTDPTTIRAKTLDTSVTTQRATTQTAVTQDTDPTTIRAATQDTRVTTQRAITLGQQNADAITAKRYARVDAVTKPRMRSLPTWDAGYDATGKRLVQSLGQGTVAVGRPVSTGAIGVGDRTYNTGKAVDVTPFARQEEVLTPDPQPAGPVKILFSVLDGAERVYCVGGDRVRPKQLFRLSSGTVIQPHIVPTGRGPNNFYWQYIRGLTGGVSEVVSSNSEVAEVSTSVEYVGMGSFQAVLAPVPPGSSSGSGSWSADATALTYTDESYTSVVTGSTTITRSISTAGPGLISDFTETFTASFNNSPGVGPALVSSTQYVFRNDTVVFEDTTPISGTGTRQINSQERVLRQASPDFVIGIESRTQYDYYVVLDPGAGTSVETSTGSTTPVVKVFVSNGSVENFLTAPAQSLFLLKWIGARYGSITGGQLFLLADSLSTVTTQVQSQKFLAFDVIDLTSSAISSIRPRIYPIPSNPSLQVHSISYS